MSGVDDDWESFLTQGAIILSNEKNIAKNNVTNSYQKNMDPTMTSHTAIIHTNADVREKDHIQSGDSNTTRNSNNDEDENNEKNKKNENSYKKKGFKNIKPMSDVVTSDETDISYFDNLADVDDLGDLDDLADLDDVGDVNDDDDDDDDDLDNHVDSRNKRKPICSNIYISTKTKISYLNEPIDIKKVFWSIPISPYSTPNECIIKKQIKVSTTDPKELQEIKELLKNEKYYQEQEIEHIDNPEGRIKFKVQLKINVGLCKKDILNYRCKLKRAFFNCFVLIMRIRDHTSSEECFKEMHIKVFNTGKLEIPGIQNDKSLTQVLELLISILKPIIGEHINFIPDKCETVLINSNFNCGYFINRDKFYNILKYKYRINSNYDACSYPGIQCKFYYIPGLEIQTGQQPPANEIDKANEISFMIFRTGSVLIVGRCDENVLLCIYEYLKNILEIEYPEIGNKLNIIEPKKQNVKLRRKIINVTENI
jgi:hypothetical protein